VVADKDLLNTSLEFDFPICTLVVHSSPVSSCFRLFPPCFRLMDTALTDSSPSYTCRHSCQEECTKRPWKTGGALSVLFKCFEEKKATAVVETQSGTQHQQQRGRYSC